MLHPLLQISLRLGLGSKVFDRLLTAILSTVGFLPEGRIVRVSSVFEMAKSGGVFYSCILLLSLAVVCISFAGIKLKVLQRPLPLSSIFLRLSALSCEHGVSKQ